MYNSIFEAHMLIDFFVPSTIFKFYIHRRQEVIATG